MRFVHPLLAIFVSVPVALAGPGDLAYGEFLPNRGCKVEATDCISFSQAFPAYGIDDNLVVECEQCVTMEEFANSEHIEFGMIDVIGTLYFPDTTLVNITTSGIVIQGKLIMEKDRVIDGVEDIVIELKGTEDLIWEPTLENFEACEHPETGDMDCQIGKRAFVVAGGTVDIRAFPKTCPSWVHLADVVRSPPPVVSVSIDKPVPLPAGCASGKIIDDHFDDGQVGHWIPSLGAEGETITADGRDVFLITNRQRAWQGIMLDLTKDSALACLQPETDYLLSVTYRLTMDQGTSACASSKTDCPSLKMHRQDEDGKLHWRTIFSFPGSISKPDGEWITMGVTLRFTQEEVESLNSYTTIFIAGPEGGVDMAFDSVTLEIPDIRFYRDPDANPCFDLIFNGDASVSDVHAFPYKHRGKKDSMLTVENEDGNNFFHIGGRSNDWNSVEIGINTDCIVKYSIYEFTARVRLHSTTEHKTRFTLTTKNPDPDAKSSHQIENVGFCSPSSSSIGWADCKANFMFTEYHESSEEMSLLFVTEGDDDSDIDYDDISVKLAYSPVSELILNTTDIDCWGVGAELMVTSHTIMYDDTKVVTIMDTKTDGSTTILTIDPPIPKHTTLKESPDYAVEVAILSREILIKPKDDVEPFQPLHGGHFMILHTPSQAQLIEGIELRKMGQQGLLGRYPLHFHMCEDASGSLLSKNTVRDSNQRCYVIHGAHNITLSQNVAYDTFGHCYMVEDGIEQDNVFEYNIGAKTKVTPDEGVLSLAESDMFASTFWISNPNNHFIGNVCAGGQDTGFWFEFNELVRGPSTDFDPYYAINPSTYKFGSFVDNVMHSYKGDGFKLYPHGYFPLEHAIFSDTRSYRNGGDGVLLHNSAKLYIKGGVYADNRVQIEIDKQADDVVITDALVVGYSDLFMLEVEASNTKSHCPAHRPNIGIQLHSFLRFRDSHGYNLTNVRFENFGESLTGCKGSSAMDMDPQVRDGHFDAYSSFTNLTFPEGATSAEKISICTLEQYGKIVDVVLEDLTGDLNPLGTGPGSIVSRGGSMSFADENCIEMEGSCAMYCQNTCYRGLNFAVSQAVEYSDWKIKAVTGDKSVEFHGYFDNLTKFENGQKIEHHLDNYIYERRRYFTATVPYGKYELQFIDGEGNVGWPTFAEMMWEDPIECGQYITDDDITIAAPTPTEEDCENLLKNSDGEEGTENHWMHTGGDVMVVSPGYNSNYAITSKTRVGAWQGPGQFLDTRCMAVGQTYEVSARIRLQNQASGEFVACNPNEKVYNAVDVCPHVVFRMREITGNRIGDSVNTTFAFPMAETLAPYDANKWNLMYGVFTVTPKIKAQSTIFMFFEKTHADLQIIVDDVKIGLTVQGCDDSSFNRDFETGDSRFWSLQGKANLDIVTPGYESQYAYKASNREAYWASMEQAIEQDCLEEGQMYSISAQVKLMKDGNVYGCDPAYKWGQSTDNQGSSCPVITLKTYLFDSNAADWLDVSTAVGAWITGSWNELHGTFKATQEMIDAPKLTYVFQKVIPGIDVIIDNVSISPVAGFNCDNLISNGDAEMGDKPYYWKPYGLGTTLNVQTSGFNSTSALEATTRASIHDGLRHNIYSSCVSPEKVYVVKAMVKMTTANGGPQKCYSEQVHNGVDAEGYTRCPEIILGAQNRGTPAQSRGIGSVNASWDASGWNELTGYFSFFPTESNADALYLLISKAQVDATILVDNVSVEVMQ